MNIPAQPRVEIRTTLDTRNGARTQWVWQTLLLAASWHAHVRPSGFPLRVFRVGPAVPALENFLSKLGAETIDSPPHPLERLSKTCNKLAALVGGDNVATLLLDNDTVFLHPDALPQPRHPDAVMAALAGNARISPLQWQTMARELNLAPLCQEWIPLAERSRALAERRPARPHHQLYLNSGVIFIPRSGDFLQSWESITEHIHGLFKGLPAIGWDTDQLDQASFAMTVALWPRFEELSLSYNYRPPLTWVGFLPADQVRIFHLTAMRAPGVDLSYRRHLDGFFAERIFAGIDRMRDVLPGEDARSTACELLRKMSSLVECYHLDRVFRLR